MLDDGASFACLIEALRPWAPDIVVVGGWAHQLHHFHPLAGALPYRPITTRDADLAFSANARLKGDIAAALKSAGFHQEFKGDENPPVTHYHLGDEDQGFYAEFVAPLTGSGVKRSGESDATVREAGIVAQKLRNVDLLLIDPVVIQIGEATGVPLPQSVDVRVANPVTFMAQKLLSYPTRAAGKRAQDALYLHDTLQLFGANLPDLQVTWVERVRPAITPKIATQIQEAIESQFVAVTDVIRAAVRIPVDRALTPGELQGACILGLREIFSQDG